MTDLVVRRLLVDLEAPIARHWCDGDAFRTALFNALSMSFPVGEQFFMDAVRKGWGELLPEQQTRLAPLMRGFVGQEATHRHLHGLYNQHLERLGLVNTWGPGVLRRRKLLEGMDVRHWLAVTAAYEHFTAILADWLLHNPELLGEHDARLRTLWLWHAAEEFEHRSVAFDLYQALGGDHARRLTWFRRATLFFIADALRQTVGNLRRDGTLWRWSTWKSAARHLFGPRGMVRRNYAPWRAYKRRDFHPSQQDASASVQWLRDNAESYVPVGSQAPLAPT